MKISWVKYTGSLELGCHLVSTSGSQDLRTRLFREILKNDIIEVQTVFSKKTLEYLHSEEGKKYFNLKNLIYNPSKTKIDKDVDILIVESGSSNAMFSTNLNGVKVPSIHYANSIIKDYKGLIMYLQIDVALNFSFFPERISNDFLRRYIKDCGYKDLFRDKKWVVTSPAKDVDEFCKNSNSLRMLYNDLRKDGLIDVERFEFHYCGIDFEEEVYEPKLETIESFLYIGGERNRVGKIKKYYTSVSDLMKTTIYGKWKEETIQKLPDINFKGILEKGKPREIYNQYFASIIIGDIKYEKVKCVSGRFFEVVTANTLPLIDVDLLDTTVSDIFSKELLDLLVVSDRKSIAEKIKLYNTEERIFLIEECVNQMKQFSPKTSYDLFIDIINKYKNKKTTTDLEKLDNLFIEKQITNQLERTAAFTENIFNFYMNNNGEDR